MASFGIESVWPQFIGLAHLAISLGATAHVLLRYRDPRSAVGWVGLVWLAPFVGALLYWLLGINRIRRRAHRLHTGYARRVEPGAAIARKDRGLEAPAGLERLIEQVARFPALEGNDARVLIDGDEAYPAMLEAIRTASRSISLLSYIFDRDTIGMRFVEALAQARARGVEVRVLVDDVGARYSLPTVLWALGRAGVEARAFNPTLLPWRLRYFNLRNHRKILVVDGRTAFTGGMNIQRACLSEGGKPPRVKDLHFEVRGPVVAQIQQVFADDWAFASGERLGGEAWFPELDAVGSIRMRGVPDGPDDDVDPLRWIVLGALREAKRSIRIVTPYFLPDLPILHELGACALSGLEVDVIVPERTNMRLVEWASRNPLRQVLETGCRVWRVPPPFDHTKLMVVDGSWVRVGSANWDTRSFRLNFEFDLVCEGGPFADQMEAEAKRRIERARPLTLDELERAPILARLRDALAGLAMPYL